MSQENNDSESKIALLLVSSLIAATVIGVVWFGAQSVLSKKSAPAVEVISSIPPSTVPVEESHIQPFVLEEDTKARYYFSQNHAAVPGDAQVQPAMSKLLELIRAGGIVQLIPFNGTTAATAAPDALVQQRIAQVRAQLARLGLPAQQLQVAAVQADAESPAWAHAQRIELIVQPAAQPHGQAQAATTAAGTAATPESAPAPSQDANVQNAAAEPNAQPNHAGESADANANANANAANGGASSADASAAAQVSAPSVGPNANADSQAASSDAPSIAVEDGVVKFYFATGSENLAANASEALLDVVAAVNSGKRAVISGFTDSTGDAAINEELSKKRAFAVRDKLISLNVPEDRIELQRPQSVTGTGNNAQARRVEVRIED